MRTPSVSSFDPRYAVVLAACMTQFTVIGCVFAYGVFLPVLEAEFGWSRLLLSSCTSGAFLVSGTLAIFAGRLSDVYGPRPVLAVTGVVYGLGYVFLSQIAEAWQLFMIYGLFIGIGIASHDVVTLSTIAGWFSNRRGTMTGLVKVGTALGQISIPPVAALLIASYGWRTTFVVMGITCLALLLCSAFLFKRPPQPPTADGAGHGVAGYSFQQARQTRQFWTICGIQFLFFPSVVTVPLHIAAHGTDIGMTIETAALLLSVLGGCSIIGRLMIGNFIDRIGAQRSYVVCFVLLIGCLIAFMFIELSWMLFVVVAFYGVGHGGLFTVVSPAVAEYFGMRAHGAIFGVVLFCGTAAAAFGPIFAGWIFDVTGSYFTAFAALAFLALVGLVLTLSLRPLEPEAAFA